MVDIVALAVDGMEPSLVEKWIDDGYLPNLARVVENGAKGVAKCRSVVSATQWTNHFTGVGSNRHGITGFVREKEPEFTNEKGSPESDQLINLSDINIKTYPEILSESGLSVGLINPLILWPPLNLDGGFCISGMLTPPSSDKWVYPESLSDTVDEFNYEIDVEYEDRPYGFIDDAIIGEVSFDDLQDDILDVLRSRIEFTKYAVDELSNDFIYSLLKSIDLIQHVFWAHMEEGQNRYTNTIRTCYQMVDDLVGWILDEYPEANLIVFSDHGFGARKDAPKALGLISHYIGRVLPTIPHQFKSFHAQYIKKEAEFDIDNLQKISGDHSRPAVLMAAGPDISSTDNIRVRFEDITPTLMTLAGHPIPTEYSGEAIREILQVEPTYDEISISMDRDLRIEPNDAVTRRLHNLGYADMVEE